ncbi:MAG: putative quinol monooxygenase [Gammaproteobacteria bacterium]|nr:putative quinol monooxygenase [Gammaproteobacteria bacterium]
MIALLAKMSIAEGKEAEFEKVMGELIDQVRANEQGNKLYTLVKNDSGYTVMEIYTSQEALAAHMQSEHFRAAGPKFAGLLAGRPELTQFEVVA